MWTPFFLSASILSMCLPKRTVVTRIAYGERGDPGPARDLAGRDEERADGHERAPHDEHAGLAEADVLEPDRRRNVEHGYEQAAERERRDERSALRHEEQQDREVDHVGEQDRRAQLALRDPAREDRVRRVQRPDVVVGVDAALEVEVVVDHVVRGVGDDEAEDGEGEQPVVDGERAAELGRRRPNGATPAGRR